MPVKGGDVLEMLPTVSEGVPKINVSFIFGEMSRLCEKVIFANPAYRSGLRCLDLRLSNLSFFVSSGQGLYNQTFTWFRSRRPVSSMRRLSLLSRLSSPRFARSRCFNILDLICVV